MDASAVPNAAQPKTRRHWYQFGLRTLLIGVTLLAIPCAYVGWQARIVAQRRTMREQYEKRGFSFSAYNEFSKERASVPWIRRVLGDEPVGEILIPLDGEVSDSEARQLDEVFGR